jgi:hypothetical protein
MENQNKYIKFRDLSIWLKIAVLGGWYQVIVFIIGFFIGFFSTLTA